MQTQPSPERARLARELHDGIAADLIALASRARRLLEESETTQVREGLLLLAERAETSLRELGQVVWALRAPSRPWGLFGEVLRERVEDLATPETAVEVELPRLVGTIDGELALPLLRATQEAVRNAVRHARARRIAVRLTRTPDRVRLEITDDGTGIAAVCDRGEGGLANLAQRARELGGYLTVDTSPYGTRVAIDCPRHRTPAGEEV